MMENQELNSSLIIRDYQEGDMNFILSSFTKWMLNLIDYKKVDDKEKLKQNLLDRVIFILSKPNIEIKILGLKDQPDSILTYCIFADDVLYFVYTKHAFRNNKFATFLLKPYIDGLKIKSFLNRYPFQLLDGLEFDPFTHQQKIEWN